MTNFFFRYLLPKFLREEYFSRDIKVIRARYSAYTGDPKVNAERLRLQQEAVKYWRI